MAYADEVLADSPVAYWPLQTDADDAAGSLDLTVTGATFEHDPGDDGPWTRWLEFGGASAQDHAQASSSTLNATGPITYEAWVWVPTDFAGSDAWAQIMGLNDRVGMRRSSTSTTRWSAPTRNASNTEIAGTEVTYDAPIGRWGHLVLVVDTAGGQKRTYIDGTLYVGGAETITNPSPDLASVSNPFTIGAQYSAPSGGSVRRWFAGRITQVAVYHSVLSAGRIAAHYAAAGDAPSVPETTGDLALTLALSSEATPVASAAGSLPVTLVLSGTAEAVTVPTATGDLGISLTLSGTATTVASTTATLGLGLGLDSAVTPVASTTGTLDLTLALSGTATDGAAPQTAGALGITLTLTGVAENLTPPPVPVTEYMPPGPDPLTTHRTESWRVDLLDADDAPLGTLDGVTGGSVEQNVNRVISGGGTLDVVDRGQDIPWLTARVQIWWQVAGVEPWPLGVFLCSAPVEQHSSVGLSWRVELLDKLLVLDEDKVDGSYSLAAGTVVTDAVRTIITSAGETAVAVTDSAETLTSGMVWEAGTSKLRICNDLLGSINYFSLRCDGHGRYVAAPYQAPASRPVVRRFVPGSKAIHLPEFTRDRDLAGIPNKVVLVSSGSGDDEALVGVASNTDADSPTSQPSRGRWIVHSEEGVEATSQTVIDNLAARRLIDLSTVTATEQIQHAAVPLGLNDVVALSGDDLPEVRAAVQSWSLTLTAGSLMRTAMREVLA